LVYKELANKLMPPEETEQAIKRLEKKVDSRSRRTYIEGEPTPEHQDGAIVIKVGLTFLAGADKPQVTFAEGEKYGWWRT
jgi:hypothetical protein